MNRTWFGFLLVIVLSGCGYYEERQIATALKNEIAEASTEPGATEFRNFKLTDGFSEYNIRVSSLNEPEIAALAKYNGANTELVAAADEAKSLVKRLGIVKACIMELNGKQGYSGPTEDEVRILIEARMVGDPCKGDVLETHRLLLREMNAFIIKEESKKENQIKSLLSNGELSRAFVGYKKACVEVNAKNRMGGFDGYKSYCALLEPGQAKNFKFKGAGDLIGEFSCALDSGAERIDCDGSREGGTREHGNNVQNGLFPFTLYVH